MLSIKQAKQDARVLRAYLKLQGIPLTQSHALEAIARLARVRDWATFVAASKKAALLSPSQGSIKNWPVFVFTIDEDDDLRETVYVLPSGTRLDDTARYRSWGVFDDSDREALTEEFKLAEDVAVTSVHSMVPRIDKYGLPDFAVEERAAEFFRKGYGFAALQNLEVSFKDTGDDSASRFWFEARVHPETAQRLEGLFKR